MRGGVESGRRGRPRFLECERRHCCHFCPITARVAVINQDIAIRRVGDGEIHRFRPLSQISWAAWARRGL